MIMNRTIMLMYLIFVISACNVFQRVSTGTETELIPPETVDGLDRDLWITFVNLINSPDCQLPCWWNLEIGETTLNDVAVFLEQIEFSRSQSRSAYPDVPFSDYVASSSLGLDFIQQRDDSITHEFRFNFSFDEDAFLTGIGFTVGYITGWLPDEYNPLLLSTLLNEQDELPMIRVREGANLIISNIEILLNYPEERFRVTYQFTLSESYPLICINSDNITGIRLGIGDRSEYAINEIYVPLAGSWIVRDSAISDEEFLQFFRDNPNTCLDLTQYP